MYKSKVMEYNNMTEKLELKGSRGSQGDQTSESDGPIDSMEPLSDAIIDSLEPLTRNEKLKELEASKDIYIKTKEKDAFKDRLSFALSVFNLMNAILGSGILGLADTLKNLGIIPFLCLLVFTSVLACYTINMLLHMSELTNLKSFEQMSLRCFGVPGKMVTCCIIILHCLGALCSYVFIMKEELPEFVKSVLLYIEKLISNTLFRIFRLLVGIWYGMYADVHFHCRCKEV